MNETSKANKTFKKVVEKAKKVFERKKGLYINMAKLEMQNGVNLFY